MRHIRTVIGAGIALVVVAGIGAGVAGLAARSPEALSRGPHLDIALRAAPERPTIEGGVMDVGALIDGYVHSDAPPRVDEPVMVDAYLPDEDDPWAGEAAYVARPVPMITPIPMPEPVREEATDAGRPLSFGFDAPRPDYAAERAERRARMEARVQAERTTGEQAAAAETFY